MISVIWNCSLFPGFPVIRKTLHGDGGLLTLKRIFMISLDKPGLDTMAMTV